MHEHKPIRPSSLTAYMLACLEAVRDCGCGHAVSIGGAIGLSHYHEYRSTKDVDAWWTADISEAEQRRVIGAIDSVLSRYGRVEERRFGDVVSIELAVEGQVQFSFQIARRSALLRPPRDSPWPPILLDSLDDLIASKMSALIDRGAPRDFLDIHQCCEQGLCAVADCWNLWQEREGKRGVTDADSRVAREAVLLHLSRIERQRPLDAIATPDDREKARVLREWFKYEFCK